MDITIILGALFIFLLRVSDVSIGTIRIVMLVRGRRGVAGALSFLESLIWVMAAAQVLSNLDSPIKIIAYAGGYATGTMLGSTIERWVAMGSSIVRIVSPVDSPEVAPVLRKHGFFATTVNAEGRDGGVRISFSVVPRKKIREVLRLAEAVNPRAFITTEEVSTVELTPRPSTGLSKMSWQRLRKAR